ncbi:hypothetical protein CDV31_016034 [Fusarium ambrosium]|uniref:Uncharacterized protein n=1 Tax=Fusarium ambrosium TaxID=131363 RepID=A0A428SFS8_9HYPO|nr:hypothetical protein CDV31_016034 [Fusarium ambrosium]
MDHRDPQTADMISKAHNVVMFNQIDTLLPKADKLTLEAGSRAIMRVLNGSTGLSDREYEILVFHHNTLPTQERYDLLVEQAYDVRITRYKDAWTQADKKLIRLACEAITQEASDH